MMYAVWQYLNINKFYTYQIVTKLIKKKNNIKKKKKNKKR